MGVIKGMLANAGRKASDRIAKLSSLSPEQVREIQEKRDAYLNEMPDPTDETAQLMTKKLLAASSVEIYHAYLPQIKDLYLPVLPDSECNKTFNVRYINITKWVTDKKENSLEKLINVYSVLSNEPCNIALVFNRTCETTNVFLGVSNRSNENDNVRVNDYIQRLQDAVRGNFPGAEWKDGAPEKGAVPCLDNASAFSVASVSNIPTEKSEKFLSQTIEKLLDGIIPDSKKKEYTIILLASPIDDVEERKLVLSEFYSSLAPYAGWQTNFTFTQSDATNSMAIFGVNAGVNAGIQNARNQAWTDTKGTTDSQGTTETDSTGESTTDSTGNSVTDSTGSSTTDSNSSTTGSSSSDSTSSSTAHTDGSSSSHADGSSTSKSLANGSATAGGGKISILGTGIDLSETVTSTYSNGTGTSVTDTIGKTLSDTTTAGSAQTLTQTLSDTVGKSLTSSLGRAVANSTGHAVTNSVGRAVAQSLGRAVSTAVATTEGITKSVNFGGNFGANFARASNETISVGKNEGITQTFTNYNIKHALAILEEQMKRFEKSTALGMWDFAAYVLCEDPNTANNVAHAYLSLTQGDESYISKSSVNLWRGNIAEESPAAQLITNYVREFKHPVFAMNPDVVASDADFNCYPPVVTATTGLSGKELAYSLNFPQKSVPGLPIIECAEFGRNIVSYDSAFGEEKQYEIGKIFHMNHEDPVPVRLSKNSLSSHVFITGSTGSGKSNTVYTILNKARKDNVHFLVIEPAKGEYKKVFPSDLVKVFGTNPNISPLLVLDPFSFPKKTHVLEHLDRLIEIFNVCWPMYAAMPAVLKKAVEKAYEDCGWNLILSTNEYGDDLFPSFADVARNIKTIIESSEYDAENKGAYKGSLLTRLESLTSGINGLIFNRKEIDRTELFDSNVIVDLSRVGSSETKSLIMGILVLKLQEHRMSSDVGMNADLQHITVLEEAHNLLKRTSTEQTLEGANLLGKSVEMLANAIAEMRTYGEGFIIADQAPGLLDMSVIRNTNTKIIMRLPDYYDRELVGKAANLDEDQVAELAKLPRGVAALYQNEWVQPVLCKVDKFEGENQYEYIAPKWLDISVEQSSERIKIAELLSKGTALGKETVLRDIRPTLEKLEIDASCQVAIMQMLCNPPREPRMTKLAPIMRILFPEIYKAVGEESIATKEMQEWTRRAERTLNDQYGTVDDITRRTIIQGVFTYYFLNELNQINMLEKWSKIGGMS